VRTLEPGAEDSGALTLGLSARSRSYANSRRG